MIDSEPTGQDGGLDANAQVQGRRVGISVLVSFIVHLGLLLILAIWSVGLGAGRGQGLTIESGQSSGSEFESFQIDSSQIQEAPVDSVQESSSLKSRSLEERLSEYVEQNDETTSGLSGSLEIAQQAATAASSSAAGGGLGFAQTSLAGRSKTNRSALVQQNGGN